MLDSEGNRYSYLSSTGMANGWYVDHWPSSTIFLHIPPKESVPVSITFKGSSGKRGKGTTFDLLSAQVLVAWERKGDGRNPIVAGGMSISIPNIQPR